MDVIDCLAYIDPGAGSMLLQILIGGLVGTGLLFRQQVTRWLRLFRRAD